MNKKNIESLKNINTLEDVLQSCPRNPVVINNIIKAYHKINSGIYNKISCAISGGADSDVMLDICHKCDNNKKIDYVWCDTGLEYQATKDHLKYLEEKYGIAIKVSKAIKPIPITCRKYGQPFMSKITSEYISRLQKHNFDFVDGEFNELVKKYPNCKIALRWWCNEAGENSSFNIKRNKWLKEFMIANPPTFKISNKCCTYAKKDVMKKYIKENDIDLNIMGVRKSEGGARATAYKSCFDQNIGSYDNYRPLFYYKDEDKIEYEKKCEITHSRCYTEYGLKRTGCAGCPFGRDFEQELQIIEKYEPKLYKAVNNIFGDSYEYTRKYKEFCRKMDEKYGSYAAYLRQVK